MAGNKMENQDNGLYGLGLSILGYWGTVLGAMWNLPSMQIISFLAASFCGTATGIYYLVKAWNEFKNKK